MLFTIVSDSSGQVVDSQVLAVDNGYVVGNVTLPALAGDYSIELRLEGAGAALLTSSQRNVTVKDEQVVVLALQSITPANGTQYIEPNQPITLAFNKAIDMSLLTVNVFETAHGNTYIRAFNEPNDSITNKGYELKRVDREYTPVNGSLGPVPGNRLVTFFPKQWFAYSGQVFIEVTYDGQELARSQFQTRALPLFIDGGVVDQFGQPVPGIDVSLPTLGRTTRTNNHGAFTFGYGDSPSQQIPAGQYDLVINPGMKSFRFGSVVKRVTLTGGERNRLGSQILPVLNKEDALTPITGGAVYSLAKGDLSLDLSNVDLLFSDGSDNGLMLAQFTTISELTTRSDPDFLSHWYMAMQPQGVEVSDDFGFEMNIPALEGRYDYLGDEGGYLLLLGTHQDTGTISPLGIGQLQGTKVVALRHQMKVLDHFGVFPVPSFYQDSINAYLQDEIALEALVLKLRSDLQRIRAGEQVVPIPPAP